MINELKKQIRMDMTEQNERLVEFMSRQGKGARFEAGMAAGALQAYYETLLELQQLEIQALHKELLPQRTILRGRNINES